MKKTILHACLVLLMFTLTTGVASATTYTITAGSGTLSYTASIAPILGSLYNNCDNTGVDGIVITTTYSGFSYTVSGTTTPLTGSGKAWWNFCPFGGYETGATPNTESTPPITLLAPTAAIVFTPSDYSCRYQYPAFTCGSAVVTPAYQGYVDPKFLVVGVTYAPPGPSTNSFVQYLNSTFVGNTESVSQSFTHSTTEGVTLTYGLKIPGVSNGKISDTYSTTNSVTTKNTSTVTSSIQVSSGEKTFGTGNYFAPVDNDYDTIWVWLNPVAIFTVFPGSSTVQWNGYGYDTNDQNGMDIVGIELGYLNGDFGAMPPDIQNPINRTWAAGQIWPAGQGPALTSGDLAQIASFDPFSVSTYGPDYIGYVPPSPQTSDYRFTLSLCTEQSSFDYTQADPSQPAQIYTCGLTYTNTSTQAQEISTTHSQTFSVDISFSGTGFLSNFSASLQDSSTLSWTTDEQSSITTSTTSTANLSDQGPPCNNAVQGVGPCIPVYDASGNQPTQYDVYQDNMFGTFMFAPVHYY